MKIIPCILTILLTSGLIKECHSQDKFGSGFYINSEGDSVIGLIGYQYDYTNSFDFKSGKKTEKQHITFEEAVQFEFFNGPAYRKLDFGTDDFTRNPVFAQILFDGSIDLYRDQGYYYLDGSERNRFRLAKHKVNNTQEARKNYQTNMGYFNIVFNDCPTLKSEAQDAAISQDGLVRLLTTYHECKSETFKINKWPNKRVINIGFFFGRNSAQIDYSGIMGNPVYVDKPVYRVLEQTNFKTSISPTYGITFLINNKNPHSLFSLQNELAYESESFEESSYYKYYLGANTITESSQITVDYSMVSYKIGSRISFRSNYLNPYLAFGLSIPLAVTSKSVLLRTTQINGVVTDTQELQIPVSISSLWISAGLKKKVFGRHFVFLEFVKNRKPSGGEGSISTFTTRTGFLF